MNFKQLFPTAVVAIATFSTLQAKADDFPNGWSQVGKSCEEVSCWVCANFYKLQKNSDKDKYGVWRQKPWNNSNDWMTGSKGDNIKNVDLGAANREMNDNCDTVEYQPTD